MDNINARIDVQATDTIHQHLKIGIDYLERKEENEFISWLSKTDAKEEELDKSYLQIAVEKHLLKVVEFLVERDPNKVGKKNKIHPFTIAVNNGYYLIVERFLKTCNRTEITPLFSCLFSYKYNQSDTVNYQETSKILLDDPALEPNLLDGPYYPLQYAAKFGDKDNVKKLLSNNASLANRDCYGELTIRDMDHEILQEHFDACIEEYHDDSDKGGLGFQFDYTTLLPINESTLKIERPLVKETDAVLHLARERNLKHLLQHPLIVSFLHEKWNRIYIFFWANLILYLLFCACLFWFIRSNYDLQGKVPIDFPYVLLCITTAIIGLREFFQLISKPQIYITTIENYFDVGLLVDISILLTYPSDEMQRRPMFAFAVLLAAIELLFLLGSVPGLSIYIAMLQKVSLNFMKFFLFNAILILAFASAFYTMFRKSPKTKEILPTSPEESDDETKQKFFSNLYLSFFKTLIMLAGEFEASDLDFDQYPLASRSIFVAFVLLVTIIILNLLNGLAVSDIGKIKNDAKLIALTVRAEYISYIESTAFDSLMRVITLGCFQIFSRYLQKTVCLKESKTVILSHKLSDMKYNTKKRFLDKVWEWFFRKFNTEESIIKMSRSIVARRKVVKGDEGNVWSVNIEGLQSEIKQLKDLFREYKINLSK